MLVFMFLVSVIHAIAYMYQINVHSLFIYPISSFCWTTLKASGPIKLSEEKKNNISVVLSTFIWIQSNSLKRGGFWWHMLPILDFVLVRKAFSPNSE